MTVPPNPPPSVHVPPHNSDLEFSVLGSVLRKPELFDALASLLGTESFYIQKHAVLWQAFMDMRKAGVDPDLVLLMDHLARTGHTR